MCNFHNCYSENAMLLRCLLTVAYCTELSLIT